MEFPGLSASASRLASARHLLFPALIVCVATATSLVAASRPDSGSTLHAGPRVTAPANVRIRVQVLNATGQRGLAMKATRYLRDRGFDVVNIGNAPQPGDSTIVLDRVGKTQWAELVARALGRGHAASAPDSGLLVDVSVLLGADWAPPANPFGLELPAGR